MKITLRCLTDFLILTFFLSSVSCLRDTIEVSNLITFKEARNVSSETINITNLFSHYPMAISRKDTAIKQWLMWDTTSIESCVRNFMYLMIVPTNDTLGSVLTDYYLHSRKFHSKNYCDTVNNINNVADIVPDMKNFDIPTKRLRVISCESKPGDFWKVPNNCIRPECLGKWKHGYSKGIGIYEEGGISKKVYWVHVW